MINEKFIKNVTLQMQRLQQIQKPRHIYSKQVDFSSEATQSGSNTFNAQIDRFIITHRRQEQETTFYEDVIAFLTRLNKTLNDPFIRKNGNINEARFYDYAYIDKSTWSSMKNNQIVPSKKTILKLAIALQLNEDEAMFLMQKAKESFDYNDTQDLVFLALINMQVYDISTVIETLEFYQYNSTPFFDSVYDNAEQQKKKRIEYDRRKKEETKRKIRAMMRNV